MNDRAQQRIDAAVAEFVALVAEATAEVGCSAADLKMLGLDEATLRGRIQDAREHSSSFWGSEDAQDAEFAREIGLQLD